MNNFSDKHENNIERKYNLLFMVAECIFSLLCQMKTNDLLITIPYTIITAAFGIFAKYYTDKKLEKIISFFANISKKIIYFIFMIIALLPTVVGYITGEITFSGFGDFTKKLCYNFVPNCLGAMIVCSVMNYLSKLNTKQTILTVIHAKKDFFDIIMRLSFMGAFLNAINYKIAENKPYTNYFNGIHLMCVVFCGAILLSVFALRMVDKQPFEVSAIQIYPTRTLLYAVLFLMSCNLPPIIWGETKHEVSLLTFNTIISLMIVWFLFFVIKRKAEKGDAQYLCLPPALFSGLVVSNLLFGIYSEKNEIMQYISGGGILLFVICIIVCIVSQSKE